MAKATQHGIEKIVYGSREALQAEYGVPEYYEGKFLVLPVGVHSYDPDGFDTLEEAEEEAAHASRAYDGAPACFIL